MLSTAIFVYAATSPVNGYFGGSLYAKQGGKRALHCGTPTLSFRNRKMLYFQAGDGLNRCSLERS